MTFYEWCKAESKDERPVQVTLADGTVYKAGEPVRDIEVFLLQIMEVVGEPELKDNIWYVNLK